MSDIFDYNSSPGGGSNPDFGFGFNDSNFSDRVLRIEIVADPTEAPPESVACQTLTDCGANRKRRRRDVARKENGDEAGASSDDSNGSEDGSRVLGVKTLHVSSLILAAKSQFFYKLFTNSMMESEQRNVTLRINSSEEAALMELLKFIYSNTLRADTVPALLEVLMAADKFLVDSCVRHCCRFLRSLALTPESALLYLNLPSSILITEAFQPLMDAAKHFLAAHYKDVSKHKDEIMNLPLPGIEAILSSDDLQVSSEDAVFDIALDWTLFHYQNNPDEIRDILSTRLGSCIRFPYMTTLKLSTVLTCNHFNHDFATKAVQDALFFKANAPYCWRKDSARFVERAYTCRPIKVVEFDVPHKQCVVYLDLKQGECTGDRICSQAFHLGGHRLYLFAQRKLAQWTLIDCFGLFPGVQRQGSGSFSVKFEFAARSRPGEDEYISRYKGTYNFTGGIGVEYMRLLERSIRWTEFVADDSPYFINGVLHLRAQLTLL